MLNPFTAIFAIFCPVFPYPIIVIYFLCIEKILLPKFFTHSEFSLKFSNTLNCFAKYKQAPIVNSARGIAEPPLLLVIIISLLFYKLSHFNKFSTPAHIQWIHLRFGHFSIITSITFLKATTIAPFIFSNYSELFNSSKFLN